MFTIKASYDSSLRMFEIPAEDLTIEDLNEQLANAFGIASPSSILVKYVDEEGDVVLVDSSEELLAALCEHACDHAETRTPFSIIVGLAPHAVEVQPTSGTDLPHDNEGEIMAEPLPAEELEDPIPRVYVAAANRLLQREGLQVSPAELRSVIQLLQFAPRIFVRAGLLTKQELRELHAHPDVSSSEEVVGAMATADVEEEGQDVPISHAIVDVFHDNGICLPPHVIQKLLEALTVKNKRFVKLGLIEPQELPNFHKRKCHRGWSHKFRGHPHGPHRHGPYHYGPHHGCDLPPPPFGLPPHGPQHLDEEFAGPPHGIHPPFGMQQEALGGIYPRGPPGPFGPRGHPRGPHHPRGPPFWPGHAHPSHHGEPFGAPEFAHAAGFHAHMPSNVAMAKVVSQTSNIAEDMSTPTLTLTWMVVNSHKFPWPEKVQLIPASAASSGMISEDGVDVSLRLQPGEAGNVTVVVGLTPDDLEARKGKAAFRLRDAATGLVFGEQLTLRRMRA